MANEVSNCLKIARVKVGYCKSNWRVDVVESFEDEFMGKIPNCQKPLSIARRLFQVGSITI